MRLHRLPAVLIAAIFVLSLGCRVTTRRHGDGGDDVKVATPFGGVSVQTDDAEVQQSTGLPPYPGAEIVAHDKNSRAADVDLSFGRFQLRVKAVSYRTDDDPSQVLAFYRQALGRYGDVIQCSGHQPVGLPTHTGEGLDCQLDTNAHSNDLDGKTELKAGSKSHQHLVAIDADGSGTKFALIALDLPSHIIFGDDSHDSRQ